MRGANPTLTAVPCSPCPYTLRLRPDCGFQLETRFDGEIAALRNCVRRLLHSGWMHWWDAVDFIAEGASVCVRVAIHCPPDEGPVFAAQLTCIASESQVRLTLHDNPPPSFDGLPDVIIKTTPDRAIGLAGELARDAVRCVALCGSGGVDNIQKPENAGAILASKSAFLNEDEGAPVILGTSHHVCMMQWHSAGASGIVTRPYEVKHIIQLLDPSAAFTIRGEALASPGTQENTCAKG